MGSLFPPDLINSILVVLQVALAVLGGFFTALWISLVIWTFRDMRSRSRDIFAQLLATLLVLIFNLPGLLIYMILRPQEKLAETYERALEEEALLQDIEERAQCPSCKRRIEQDYLVCPSCYTRLKKPCVNCGRILRLKWKVCPYCEADQTPPAEPPAELPAEPAPVEPPVESYEYLSPEAQSSGNVADN